MAGVELRIRAAELFSSTFLVLLWWRGTARTAEHVNLPRARPEVVEIHRVVRRSDGLLRVACECPLLHIGRQVGIDPTPRILRAWSVHDLVAAVRWPIVDRGHRLAG